MNPRTHHIITGMAKLPLLLLYTSFFFVQLFYNFDINARVSGKPVFSQLHSNKEKTELVKSAIPKENKNAFRLNKRYHPQEAITCNTIIIKPLICHVASKQHAHYSSGFIPSSLPTAHALRGPPVV